MICFAAIVFDEVVNFFIHEPASVSQTTQTTYQISIPYCDILDVVF